MFIDVFEGPLAKSGVA